MGKAIRMTRTWSGAYQVPFSIDAHWVREAGRIATRAAVLFAFLYAASIAWDLVQELRTVKLYQLRQVLRIASVGDLLLLWAAYTLAREFIRALGRRPREGELS